MDDPIDSLVLSYILLCFNGEFRQICAYNYAMILPVADSITEMQTKRMRYTKIFSNRDFSYSYLSLDKSKQFATITKEEPNVRNG